MLLGKRGFLKKSYGKNLKETIISKYFSYMKGTGQGLHKSNFHKLVYLHSRI